MARRQAWSMGLVALLVAGACEGPLVGPPLPDDGGTAGASGGGAAGALDLEGGAAAAAAAGEGGEAAAGPDASGATAGAAGVGGAAGSTASQGGAASGGLPTGGAGDSGAGRGGDATGGFATGGAVTGGSATGGTASGGLPTAGAAGSTAFQGGAGSGGVPTGGTVTGGAGSGGVPTGGVPSGGATIGGSATGGDAGGYFDDCASPPCTLQELIDEAPDGSVIAVGPEPVAANVTVGSQRVTLACDTTGTLTRFRCADPNQQALTAGPGADVTVEGCVFEDCAGGTGETDGSGAILVQSAARLVVRRCIFRNLQAHRGAALSSWVKGSDLNLDPDASLVFENNVVYGNEADDAAAIYLRGAMTLEIVNNLFYDNVANDYSAAIWLRDQERARLTFRRNVVYGCSAARGAPLETYSGEGPVVNSSIVLGNTPEPQFGEGWSATYTLTSGAHPFVDPAAGDFALRPGTAAIDAGDPAIPNDLDGTRADQGVEVARLPLE